VDDFPVMEEFQRQANGCEPFEYGVLLEVIATFDDMLPQCAGHELHNNADVCFFSVKSDEFENIRVIETFQECCLLKDFADLFLGEV
jgi:hypothetical protein